MKAFLIKYQHHLSIGSFFVGFALDTILLKRIDLLLSNVVLYGYLAVVVIVMCLLHLESKLKWLPFVAQFAFGGMFSGFLIFYSQSGALAGSWPFLAIIIGLIITNEYLRSYHKRLQFQTVLLFFCLYSFAIYTLPILIGAMGAGIFLLSGLTALVLITLFVLFLFYLNRKRVEASRERIVGGVLFVYTIITTLYFLNLVPPIPLSLRTIGVYHAVAREGTAYVGQEEHQEWYGGFFGTTVHLTQGAPLTAFSAVFIPTGIASSVVHEWQFWGRDGWETHLEIPFKVEGGRDRGYRVFSTVEAPTAGEWRVNVRDSRGALIGREGFVIERVNETVPLQTRILE